MGNAKGNAKGKGPEDFLASYGAGRGRWPIEARSILGRGPPQAEAEALRIDQFLDLASQPTVPEGSLARLLDQLPDAATAEIVGFRPRLRGNPPLLRYAALPLAASLALGIYLGAQGDLDVAFPAAITGTVAQGDDVEDDLGGVGELDAYAMDNIT